MTDRYPGYDVLAKRRTPSWNEQTRRVIDERLALHADRHVFFDHAQWQTLKSVCNRIIPQPFDRPAPVPIAAMIDAKLANGVGEGYRDARMPPMGEAWRRGLKALDAEAGARHGRNFHELTAPEQDGILAAAQQGYLDASAWKGVPAKVFFESRIIPDIVGAYYAHPTAWSEIGFGGPAAPRGYVRLDIDRRDPWEASEAQPGREARARVENRRVGRN